jgi:glycosyltransferase involved in cell wall biosynthesis
MRIAQIAPPWIPIPPKNYGGTESVISNLIEEQIAQGHKVTLFAPGDARTSAKQISFFPRSLFEEGVPWQAHLKAFFHLHRSVEYVQKHIHNFDIVHMHLSSGADMYLFPLTATLPLPRVVTLHSQFPFDRINGDWQGDADRYYLEWLLQTPLVAISKSAKEQEQRKLPLNFIDVVHHGINVKDFPPLRISPENFFIWLGRLVPEKGAHLAIEAAKKARVPLVIAGIVDTNIPEAKEYFEKQIEPQLDEQQIRYIGPVGLKKRNDLLRRARAMLNPLQWEEPFGMVMVEAMAAGCPVIAFSRGAVEEIITSDEVGFVVKDVDEMVERIHAIDSIDRRKVREYIEANFSVQKMVENYTRVYQRLIDMDHNLIKPIPPTPETSSLNKAVNTLKPLGNEPVLSPRHNSFKESP